jgi:hypothetical protein
MRQSLRLLERKIRKLDIEIEQTAIKDKQLLRKLWNRVHCGRMRIAKLEEQIKRLQKR